MLDIIQRTNFTELCPDHPLNNYLPQFNISENGMAKIDKEKILNGMNFDPHSSLYVNIDFFTDTVPILLIKSNPDFNLYRFLELAIGLNLYQSPHMDPFLKDIIEYYIGNPLPEFKSKNASLEVNINK